jgi:hypothetical protein
MSALIAGLAALAVAGGHSSVAMTPARWSPPPQLTWYWQLQGRIDNRENVAAYDVRALQPHFDGALVEQCNQYSECGAYRPYLRAGKPVLNAEYRPSLYPRFCTAENRAGLIGALYNLALNGRRFRPCWRRG